MNVQPTTTITLDGQNFDVAKLSTEIQQMVLYLDDWRQREVDATSELLMVRGGLRDLQSTLSNAIQQEIKETKARAEALGLVVPEATVSDTTQSDKPAANDNEAS